MSGTTSATQNLSRFSRRNRASLKSIATINNPIAQKIKAALIKANSPLSSEELKLIGPIEQYREECLLNNSPLITGDLGEGGLYDKDATISRACKASKPYPQALYLYHLIRELQPNKILELGTNIGVSSAYMALAAKINGKGTIVTCEASQYRIRLAKSLHNKLALDNIKYAQGLFTDTLTKVLSEHKPIDYAFIDGHHQYQPTIDYFNEIKASATDPAVFVFDDIYYNEGMVRAWNEIKAGPGVQFSISMGALGIIAWTKSDVKTNPTHVNINTNTKPRTIKSLVKKVIKKVLGR